MLTLLALGKVNVLPPELVVALVLNVAAWLLVPKYLCSRIPVAPSVNISEMRRSMNL
jgi:hypothetical protein